MALSAREIDNFSISACVISNNYKHLRFSQLCFLLKIVLSRVSPGKFPGDAHGKKYVFTAGVPMTKSLSAVAPFVLIRLLRVSSFEVRSHWRCKLAIKYCHLPQQSMYARTFC